VVTVTSLSPSQSQTLISPGWQAQDLDLTSSTLTLGPQPIHTQYLHPAPTPASFPPPPPTNVPPP
jgi:hypothetical protein